jgi:alpha-glucosidase
MADEARLRLLGLLARRASLRPVTADGMPRLNLSVAENLPVGGGALRLEARPEGLWFCLTVPGADMVGLRLGCDAGEGFMGFGEQFSHLDMAGRRFVLCTGEQGIGRGAQPLSALINLFKPGAAGNAFTTYAPQPVFLTTGGRAFCFEQHSIYWINLKNTRRGRAEITVWGDTLSGWLFEDISPLGLVEKHTAVTGRARPLPPFAYGAILGLRGGKERVTEVLEKCLAHRANISALWIEDWQGRRGKNGGPPLWWRWYPDETAYPGFKRWAEYLGERGIALMGYANPFLSADEGNPLYTEGRAAGYFIKNTDGSNYVSHFFSGREYTFVCVDLTNPDAYAWLKARMKTGMLENGLSGWMADYGEYIPLEAAAHCGDTVWAHCALPALWARLNAEMIDEAGGRGRILAFHRSAGAGSNRYASAYWAGDQNPTFDAHDGLASSITALVTSGISGMSVNHTDIGGFTTLITPIYKLARKKEVMLRWMEYAAFTPIFRTHDGAYDNPANYQFYHDEEGYAAFARYANLHAALGWYIAELEKDAVARGWPMVRALWLHYPQEKACRAVKHQYLFGPDLLVSPVCSAKVSSVKAYVPSGQWFSPYGGAVAGGQWHKLPAPLGRPAVLVRGRGKHAERLLETLRAHLA